jgi:hypothetical protein
MNFKKYRFYYSVAILLAIGYTLKYTGVLKHILNAYSSVATTIMKFVVGEEFFSQPQAIGVKPLLLIIPAIALLSLSLLVYRIIKAKRKSIRITDLERTF